MSSGEEGPFIPFEVMGESQNLFEEDAVYRVSLLTSADNSNFFQPSEYEAAIPQTDPTISAPLPEPVYYLPSFFFLSFFLSSFLSSFPSFFSVSTYFSRWTDVFVLFSQRTTNYNSSNSNNTTNTTSGQTYTSVYPDPWQNDEYFYQYGKLVSWRKKKGQNC